MIHHNQHQIVWRPLSCPIIRHDRELYELPLTVSLPRVFPDDAIGDQPRGIRIRAEHSV